MALSFVVTFSFVKRVQISTLKDELRRVTAEALGKDEEHQAAQASALATEDELRRVTAEALGKDEEHQAAQASALATEKVVRYTTVMAVLICSFVVYMEGTAVAIAARLEVVS